MTKLTLAAKIDPLNFARAGRQVKGALDFSAMPRLNEVLAESEGEAEFELNFKKDEEGFVVIEVRVQAALPLVCQRCVNTFLYKLALHSELSPIADEAEAKNLPPRYDAWPLSEEQTVSPKEIVEEELLLSLPIVPMHDKADCPAAKTLAKHAEKEQVTHKPFEVLKKLK